jgi:hypothetical protein
MVSSIARIQSPLNVLLNKISFITIVPKYLNCDTFSNDVCNFIGPDIDLHSDNVMI